LEKAAAAATAVIVGAVRGHIDEIFLPHDFLDHIAKIFSYRISKGFSNKLTRILNGKLYLQILVPIGIDFKFSFTNPLSIILNDAFDFKVVRNIEFFQSGPDCKEFVPSLRVEPDFTAQILYGFGLDADNMLP
jgi:hypothetical protein